MGSGKQCKPTHAEHEQDFLSRVGVRRQGVATKHRQGQLFRQQRLAQALAAQRAADQKSLRELEQRRYHTKEGIATMTPWRQS